MTPVDDDQDVQTLRRSVPTTGSAMAFALGACMGVRIVSMPILAAQGVKLPA
jgi:hypothetical protein